MASCRAATDREGGLYRQNVPVEHRPGKPEREADSHASSISDCGTAMYSSTRDERLAAALPVRIKAVCKRPNERTLEFCGNHKDMNDH